MLKVIQRPALRIDFEFLLLWLFGFLNSSILLRFFFLEKKYEGVAHVGSDFGLRLYIMMMLNGS